MARKGLMVGENEHPVQNEMLTVGSSAPDFSLIANDLSAKSLADYGEQVKLISVIPSIDTGVCSIQTQRFNELASSLENTVVLTVSADMPFALGRYCGSEGHRELGNAVDAQRYEIRRRLWRSRYRVAHLPTRRLCAGSE